MPPKFVEPKGEESVKIESGQTRIFWLKFNTHHQTPGNYQGGIEFFVNGESAGRVELDIRIHPVHVPTRRLITVQPFGHVYGDVNNPAPAMRFNRNLRDHGFEWSLINALRPNTFLVKGEPLTPGFIQANVESMKSDHPPFIDFSSMDGFIDAAIDHNLTYFRITQNLTKSIDALTRKTKLSEEDRKAARQWYLRQFSRYLKDKGILHAYVSMGDELSADELKNWFVPWSEDLAEAGLRSTSSFTTASVADPELTAKLSQTVGAWTLNRLHVGTFMDWIAEGKIRLPAGVLVGTYGAGEGRGTEIRKNASDSRMIGWEAWALGANYCAPNPYFKGWIYYTEYRLDRGIGGERFVSYLDIDDLDAPLVNSPFIEGIRESIEEANLAAVMKWYLEKLGNRVPGELSARAARVVGTSEDDILQWEPRKYGKFIRSTREQYAAAKDAVLEILDELGELAKTAGIQPSLYWHGVPLVSEGRAKAVIVSAGDVSTLQEAIQGQSGIALPVSAELTGVKDGYAILVAGEGEEAVPSWMKEQLGEHAADYSWIREMKSPDAKKTVLWIGGTDAKQVKKAQRQFVSFLRPEGAWLIP